ncbi:MAG: response regulator [Alphaproteobacteria bacterium]|nr:response regulator [Alphaproteobacteria bacterium]MBU1549386.1 response regulator [Alphaproteobacteria bacterium]MBU2338151.1 response regulator [Alphaproteobacteria bacterium]MBU2387538.1 response regulator [Alphaproteobacteria bacterium]
MHVLLLEDDLVLGGAVRDHVFALGHDAHWEAELGKALNTLALLAFDMVLLDLRLPDGDGLTLLRDVRSRSSVPVIVMTASDLISDRHEAIRCGATDFLVKPFDLACLTSRMRFALS